MARRPPPPPPPRRRDGPSERLRRIEARHREEERAFEPERAYPRETRPHHFAVNAYEENPRLVDQLALFFRWLAEVNDLMRYRSGESVLDYPEFVPEEAFLLGISPELFVAEAFG